MSQQFPVRLKHLRSDHGITRRRLANAIGVSIPTLWGWETGRTRPRAENLVALARALGVSPAYLSAGRSAVLTVNSDDLDNFVTDARLQIAHLTGVEVDKVRISIDL
jgi:transcriptional regulator with XRE-family HTH domain